MIGIRTARQIGAVIRDARTKSGLTQQQLADVANVSRGFIARLEKGAATALYPEKLLAVLNALGLSLFIGESQANEAEAAATPSVVSVPLIAAADLAKAAKQAATIQEAIPASAMKAAEQFAAITANSDFLKTSPLLTPREPRRKGEDDE